MPDAATGSRADDWAKVSLPSITLFSPTACLVALNVLVFAAMVASGVSAWDPQSGVLLKWGANFGPLTMGGQWWRLVTYMFLHVGIVHLLVNMWGLWVLGRVGEHLYGTWRFVGLYLLSGLGGGVASMARNPMVVSAGASGALFGIAGALVATSLFGMGNRPWRLAPHAVRSLVLVIAANLAFGFVYSRIDNGAHIGGLVSGFLLGAILSVDFRRSSQGSRLSPAMVLFPLMGVIMAGSAAYVAAWRVPAIDRALGREALQHGNAAVAIRQFQRVVASRPDNSSAHEALGAAYLLARKPSAAQKEYARALELDPSSVKLRKQLAALEVQMGKPDLALKLLQEASKQDASDAEIFLEMGVLYQQMGKDAEALPLLQKAASLQPNSPLVQQALGLTCLHLGRNEQAISALQQAHRLAPQRPDILMALANAYEGKGMSAAADQAYEQAYQLRSARRN